MNRYLPGLSAALLLCCGSVWAANAPAGVSASGAPPTRLQHCQQEVRDQSGDARKRALRDCLMRRNEGEAGVLADCRRQLRIGGAQLSAAQQQQMRDCETRALAVPSQQLPRRPAPRVVPAPAPSMSGSPASGPPRAVPPSRAPVSVREGA